MPRKRPGSQAWPRPVKGGRPPAPPPDPKPSLVYVAPQPVEVARSTLDLMADFA